MASLMTELEARRTVDAMHAYRAGQTTIDTIEWAGWTSASIRHSDCPNGAKLIIVVVSEVHCGWHCNACGWWRWEPR